MQIEEVLEKLNGVIPRAGGWVAFCPSHDDDGKQSLKVDETEDGNILLKCFAGCSFEEIAKALGMNGKRDRLDASKAEATYDYVDERGSLLFQVLRMPGKEFPSRHPVGEGQWQWGLEGVRRVLYRLPQVVQAVRQGQWVVVTEGEKDADAVSAAGEGFVGTCNAGGAGKWRPEYAQLFAGAKVIIWADKDEPGRNHSETIRKSLIGVASEIHVVQSAVGKDAHDHLVGANLTMKEVVRAENQFLIQRGIITAKDLAERAREDLTMTEDSLPGYTLVPGVDVTWRNGRFYAIGGYTGDGKTTYLMHGVRTLATQRKRGGIFSLEMPERDLRNRLISHRGIPLYLLEEPWRLQREPEMLARYHEAVEEIAGWDLDIIFDTQVTAEKIAEITRERDYDWVAIDHIHRFGWGADRRSLEGQVMKLTNLAIEANVMVIVLCQLRRYQRGKDFDAYPQPSLQDFRETEMIGQDASMAISVWRRRESNGLRYLPEGQTEVQILKNRHVTSRTNATGRSFFVGFDDKSGLYTAGQNAPALATDEPEEVLTNDPWFTQNA